MKAIIAYTDGILVLPPNTLGLGDYFAIADIATWHYRGSNVPRVYEHFGPVDVLSVCMADFADVPVESPDHLLAMGKLTALLAHAQYDVSDPLVRLYVADPLYHPSQVPATPPDPPVVH